MSYPTCLLIGTLLRTIMNLLSPSFLLLTASYLYNESSTLFGKTEIKVHASVYMPTGERNGRDRMNELDSPSYTPATATVQSSLGVSSCAAQTDMLRGIKAQGAHNCQGSAHMELRNVQILSHMGCVVHGDN